MKTLVNVGGAKASDRTMLDALLPAVRALEAAVDQGEKPVDAWASRVAA